MLGSKTFRENSMPKSIIQPLLREHARMRTLAGELRAHTERFDLPGMRHTSQQMLDAYQPHTLKEESVLFLIGMKFLKANNKPIPELFKSHDQIMARLYRLTTLLFSARLTNIEDQARHLVFVLLETLDKHFEEEEAKVFPALESLIDDETKELILARYGHVDGDGFDELDRMPLLSLPDTRVDEPTMDTIGPSDFAAGAI